MPPRKWFGLAALTALPGALTLLVANGCAGDSPSGAGTPESGGALSPLGCPPGCLPPAAPGWTGPSAVYDGPASERPATCPAIYTHPEVLGHQEIKVGDTTCECDSLGTESGGKCVVTVESYTTTDCTGAATTTSYEVPGTACVDTPAASSKYSFLPKPGTGSCVYPNPKVTGPEPTFKTVDVACGLPQNAAVCADKAECVAAPIPDQPFTRICIHKAGVETCPSADYATKFVAYENTVDDRTCTCGGRAFFVGCIGYVDRYENAACPAGEGIPADSQCVTGTGSIDVSRFAPWGKNACLGGGTISGSGGAVHDADPVTFCCIK